MPIFLNQASKKKIATEIKGVGKNIIYEIFAKLKANW